LIGDLNSFHAKARSNEGWETAKKPGELAWRATIHAVMGIDLWWELRAVTRYHQQIAPADAWVPGMFTRALPASVASRLRVNRVAVRDLRES